LVSPPFIFELDDIISIIESSCTASERLILLSWLAGFSEVRGSDTVESGGRIIQEKKELYHVGCY
jgi:hypothetical protein